MIALLVGMVALGAELGQVVVVDGVLTPGRVASVQVAKSPVQATTRPVGAPSGTTATDLSDLRLSGALLLRTRSTRDGVAELELVPDHDATEVEVRLGSERFRFPVTPEPATPLAHPPRVSATTVDELVDFDLTSTTNPTLGIDDVGVYASEGTVRLASTDEGGIRVTLTPNASSAPRVVPVVVADHRAARRPAVLPVVLRAKPRLTVNATPGSDVTLTVGRRTYGPVTVPETGAVSVRIDQYPGEAFATVRASDDLGNTTTSELPLAVRQQPSVVVAPARPWLPGEPPPPLYVVAMRPNGAPSTASPRCETPRADLEVRSVRPGWWAIELPRGGDLWRSSQQGLRVVCTVDEVTRTAKVEPVGGIPDRLALKVWPENLRSDFPVAELRAVVEDARGDRVGVGGLAVVAERGRIEAREADGTLRGEYRGEAAIPHGGDRVSATYVRPPGPGPVTQLQVGFGPVPGPEGGAMTVHARALNGQREPVAYVPLQLEADGQSRSVMTQADGWASTILDVPEGRRPRVVTASNAVVSRNAVALPGEPGIGGPDTPDLLAEQAVQVRAGRIAAVTLAVEPKILRAAPGSVGNIVVRLEDRSGRPVVDEPVGLEASEGRIVLPIDVRPDGTLVAQYIPEPATREARQVQITATTEGFRSSTEIEVEPRPARVSVGPFAGIQSNFGDLQSFLLGLDLDLRTRSKALGDTLTVRLGIHNAWHGAEASLPDLVDARIRTNLTSLDLAAAFRDDRGPVSVWLGLGGSLALQWDDIRFDEVRLDEPLRLQSRSLLAGPMILAGLSRRAPLGEWVIEARGHWLPATAGSAIGYTGNLGGLSVGFGYRLVY